MALAALASDSPHGRLWATIIQHRFGGNGALAGHPIGNLLLAGISEVLGDPVAALDEVGRILEQITRQRRHLDINMVVASQDPQRLPKGLLQNLDGVGVFQHSNESWWKALCKVAPPMEQLPPSMTAKMPAGQGAFYFHRFWMQDPRVPDYQGQLLIIDVRPRFSLHGGGTKPALPALISAIEADSAMVTALDFGAVAR